MVSMSSFVTSEHPRSRAGRFIAKDHDLPESSLEVPADEQADYEDWMARNEQWADDVASGAAAEPDPESGTVQAWSSEAAPF